MADGPVLRPKSLGGIDRPPGLETETETENRQVQKQLWGSCYKDGGKSGRRCTSVVPRMRSERQFHFGDCTDITDVFQVYVNLFWLLVAVRHLPPDSDTAWWRHCLSVIMSDKWWSFCSRILQTFPCQTIWRRHCLMEALPDGGTAWWRHCLMEALPDGGTAWCRHCLMEALQQEEDEASDIL